MVHIYHESLACLVMPEETSIETGTLTRHAVQFLKKEFPDTFDVKFNCEAKNIVFSSERVATAVETTQGYDFDPYIEINTSNTNSVCHCCSF